MKLEPFFPGKGSKLDNKFLNVLKCLCVHVNTLSPEHVSTDKT
jgi:hypothetical protein